jgi:hypothetical protein
MSSAGGACGVFAAGHLGELTQVITQGLVDEALAASRRVQARVRKLPSRVVVYFVLAMALFSRQGYRGVWSHLVCSIVAADTDPSASALSQARRRIGAGPLVALFDRVKGPLARPDCPGSHWRGLLVVAWDGTSLPVADTAANAAFFGRYAGKHGAGGFPAARLTALVECGTRAVIDAVDAAVATHERIQVLTLCRSLRPGMLLLADRGFEGFPQIAAAAATGAQLLWRLPGYRALPVLHVLPDGSYLSLATDVASRRKLDRWLVTPIVGRIAPQVSGVAVRIIEAQLAVRDDAGVTTVTTIRLLTTLLDPDRWPAADLVRLYHQRWEVETAFLGLKVSLGQDTVLRSGQPETVRQELFALLSVYQAMKTIGAAAAATAGVDPDRISLTVTVRTAQQTVTMASGTRPDAGTPKITAAVLHPRELAPPIRRPRTLPRRVKRPISTFAYNATRYDSPRQAITIKVTITLTDPRSP